MIELFLNIITSMHSACIMTYSFSIYYSMSRLYKYLLYIYPILSLPCGVSVHSEYYVCLCYKVIIWCILKFHTLHAQLLKNFIDKMHALPCICYKKWSCQYTPQYIYNLPCSDYSIILAKFALHHLGGGTFCNLQHADCLGNFPRYIWIYHMIIYTKQIPSRSTLFCQHM